MDKYYTVSGPGSSKYTEKMSRFLSFALPVGSADEARELIKTYQNEYHDARHVCWAYMLGPERREWQLNPILGQINSAGLTDVLVVVVRYFGGIKLGTSGLIAAYREASRLALQEAGVKECRQTASLRVEFGYESADKVMRIVKHPDVEIISKEFDNMCRVSIRFPLDMLEELKMRLGNVETAVLDPL